jgi:hypothetical protein
MATVGNASDLHVQQIINNIPCQFTQRALQQILRQGAITSLTAATGTASDTITDVGAAFSQTVINDNIKSLADKINAVIVNLNRSGVNDN